MRSLLEVFAGHTGDSVRILQRKIGYIIYWHTFHIYNNLIVDLPNKVREL